MTKSSEIKVLSGVHAGARALLKDPRTVIGSAPDSDIVLTVDDIAPHHAALTAQPDGRVTVEPLDGPVIAANGAEIAAGTALAPFTPVALGSSILAVGPAGSAWPRIDLATFGRAAPPPAALSPVPSEMLAVPSPAATSGIPAASGTALAGRPPGRVAAVSRSPYRLYPIVALLGVGIVFIGFSWFTGADGVTTPAVEAPASVASPLDIATERLARLPYAQGVEVRAVSDRVLLATGYVELSTQKASLKDTLTLDGVEVVHRIWAMDEIVGDAATRAAQLMPSARVAALGPGEVAVGGYVPDETLRARVVAAIREDIPGIRAVRDDMISPQDVRQAVREALAASPLRDRVTLAQAGDALTATGSLNEEEMAQWRGLMERVSAETGTAVPVQATFVPRGDDLPFVVRSVVTGAHRYVVTGDGRRISEGGQLAEGYRLVAIGDGEITIRRNEFSFVQRFKE